MAEESGCIVEEVGDARLKWLLGFVFDLEEATLPVDQRHNLLEMQRLARSIRDNPPTVVVRLENGGATPETSVQGVKVEVRDYDVGGMSTVDALNSGCVVDEDGRMYKPVVWNEKGELVG